MASPHDSGFAASLSGYPSLTTERKGRPLWGWLHFSSLFTPASLCPRTLRHTPIGLREPRNNGKLRS
jgi:hypothetical protein